MEFISFVLRELISFPTDVLSNKNKNYFELIFNESLHPVFDYNKLHSEIEPFNTRFFINFPIKTI